MRWTKKTLIIICLSVITCIELDSQAQQRESLTLFEVIDIAKERSIDAMLARHTFMGSYWEYVSHRANFLPSLSLNGNIPSFDRSLSALQDATTGEYNYLQNYVMRTDMGLNLRQNIGLTGGTVSLNSSMERMDQFSPERRTSYNSSPISLIINQPIGAFNRLKWDKKIEPVKYERAKYVYLEAIERVVNTSVELFFNQLIAQRNLGIAEQNHANTDTLYNISKKRFEIGTITHSDLLQLELRLLNEGISINENQLRLDLAKAKLKSYLGYYEETDITLIIPQEVPDLKIDLGKVYHLSVENTSFAYRQKIQQLEAEKAVAQAKANRNPQISLYMRFGLNQVANEFSGAYQNLLDQETVRLGVSVPIFDGGVAKGRTRMAQSQKEVIDATIERDKIDQQQDAYLKVMQFNNQSLQCRISLRADSIAYRRYELSMQQFASGRLSVLELNTAQSERDAAHNRLINELYNFWNYYYSIQRMTLYDFFTDRNISTNFDTIIQ